MQCIQLLSTRARDHLCPYRGLVQVPKQTQISRPLVEIRNYQNKEVNKITNMTKHFMVTFYTFPVAQKKLLLLTHTQPGPLPMEIHLTDVEKGGFTCLSRSQTSSYKTLKTMGSVSYSMECRERKQHKTQFAPSHRQITRSKSIRAQSACLQLKC